MSPREIYVLLTVLTCLVAMAAIWKGGPGERMAGFVMLANTALAYCARLVPSAGEFILQLTNDALTAMAFLAITLRYGRPWLGAVMLFYAAQFALHSVYFVTDRPRDRLHSIVNNVDFFFIHLCLILGTLTAWRDRAKAHAAG